MPSDSGYDALTHLSWGYLAVDNLAQPSTLSIRLKALKTDPFRKGITLYIGKVPSNLCPVAAMLAYILVQGQQVGPLFQFKDGRSLTRQKFVMAVRDALKRAGIRADKYAGHSFRIGAATTAAARGIDDSIIKTLSR